MTHIMQQQALTQAIAAIFTIFALSRAYLRFKEKKLSSFAFIFWMAVWISGVIMVFNPAITNTIAFYLGIGRGVDVIMYFSIAIIFYLIFRIYIKIEDTQKQITELVRLISLKKTKSLPRKVR